MFETQKGKTIRLCCIAPASVQHQYYSHTFVFFYFYFFSNFFLFQFSFVFSFSVLLIFCVLCCSIVSTLRIYFVAAPLIRSHVAAVNDGNNMFILCVHYFFFFSPVLFTNCYMAFLEMQHFCLTRSGQMAETQTTVILMVKCRNVPAIWALNFLNRSKFFIINYMVRVNLVLQRNHDDDGGFNWDGWRILAVLLTMVYEIE